MSGDRSSNRATALKRDSLCAQLSTETILIFSLQAQLIARAMAGYSGTPLWKKLGYKQGVTALVEGAPKGYVEALTLPEDISVKWSERASTGIGFIHLFATAKSELKTKVQRYRKLIAADAVIWVSWPKKSSGVETDITEDVVREIALPTGLVDIKVCAVDDIWSGLKLVIRKELR
jgi:hypothetical protein